MSTMTVWKYPLRAEKVQLVKAPAGARMLTVMLQGDTPCLWAMVDPSAPEATYQIEAYPTGGAIPNAEGLMWIATTQDLNGSPLVFHFFERMSGRN